VAISQAPHFPSPSHSAFPMMMQARHRLGDIDQKASMGRLVG
jgi:hypothetical protein